MTLQRRDFLLVVTLAAAAATPAFGQAVAPTIAPSNSGKVSAASTPDFSGIWVHGSIPGFEPLASGPTSLVNRSRRSVAQLRKRFAPKTSGGTRERRPQCRGRTSRISEGELGYIPFRESREPDVRWGSSAP